MKKARLPQTAKERTALTSKTATYILVALLLFGSACSQRYQTSSSYDDVYYSTKDDIVYLEEQDETNVRANPDDYTTDYYNPEESPTNNRNLPDNSTSEEYTDGQGNTYVTNNYYSEDNYDYDDYYDYAYASRLRRFYSPSYGYNYYDSYYTNTYWYDYNPYNWGMSIYLGYNWWPFSYYNSWNYSPYYGYYGGNPYNHHHCGNYGYGYGNPYGYGYGYGNGYGNGYGYGYGYNNGYYGDNYNPYYYNSYDATSHYYGPRNPTSSNGRNSQQTLAQLYEGPEGPKKTTQIYTEAPNDVSKINSVTDNKAVASPGSSSVKGAGQQTPKEDYKPAVHTGTNTGKGAVIKTGTDPSVYTSKPATGGWQTIGEKPATKNTYGNSGKGTKTEKPVYTTPNRDPNTNSNVVRDYSKYKSYNQSREVPGESKTRTYNNPGKSNNNYSPPKRSEQQQPGSRNSNVYSKPKTDQKVNKPRSYNVPNYSKPKTSSPKNYSKPGNYSKPRSNYGNRSGSTSQPRSTRSAPSRSSSPSKNTSKSRR